MAGLLILTPDPDWDDAADEVAHQLAHLSALGLEFDTRPWTDAGDMRSYDRILPIMAWGYHQHADRWAAALDAWEGLPLSNPVAVLRWNAHKSYLMDLQTQGVAVVPTRMSDALTKDDIAAARAAFACNDLVIKPPVSGGADGTFLLRGPAAVPASSLGQAMMIQPMMESISSEGEFSLFYFAGTFSHAILKTPQSGDFRVQAQFGGRDADVDPPEAAQALAQAALAAAPGSLTYARVDMVRHGDAFALMELELIEPYLWLHRAPDGGRGFVGAVS